jgi:hypothetical protein
LIWDFWLPKLFVCLFIFVVLGFELTALFSPGSRSTTGATLPAPKTVRGKFLLFKLPGLWYFAMAALADK